MEGVTYSDLEYLLMNMVQSINPKKLKFCNIEIRSEKIS